jgi:hypothetical protein
MDERAMNEWTRGTLTSAELVRRRKQAEAAKANAPAVRS